MDDKKHGHTRAAQHMGHFTSGFGYQTSASLNLKQLPPPSVKLAAATFTECAGTLTCSSGDVLELVWPWYTHGFKL